MQGNAEVPKSIINTYSHQRCDGKYDKFYECISWGMSVERNTEPMAKKQGWNHTSQKIRKIETLESYKCSSWTRRMKARNMSSKEAMKSL